MFWKHSALRPGPVVGAMAPQQSTVTRWAPCHKQVAGAAMMCACTRRAAATWRLLHRTCISRASTGTTQELPLLLSCSF